MRRSVIFLLLLIIILSPLINALSTSQIAQTSLSNTIHNSLLPPSPNYDDNEIAIVAALDGTVYLVDTKSHKTLWSFSSGGPIYSSYHDTDKYNDSQLSKDFYIDCGDDWELYVHSKRFGKAKLALTADEYIRRTPYISEDGEITLGAKKSTVFVVDVETGRVIRSHRLDDLSSTLSVQSAEDKPLLLVKDAEDLVDSRNKDLGTVQQLVYIMRTDYVLQHYCPKSGEVLWNVAFAEIEAEFRCREIENPFGGVSPNTWTELGAEYTGDFELPLPCQTRTVVHRIRGHNLLEFDRLANAHFGGGVLSLPDSNHSPLLGPVDRYPLAIPSNVDRLVPVDRFPLAIPNNVDRRVPVDTPLGPVDRFPLAIPNNVDRRVPVDTPLGPVDTPLGPVDRLPRTLPNNAGKPVLTLPFSGDSGRMNATNTFAEIVARSHLWSLITFLTALMSLTSFIFYRSKQGKLNKEAEESKVKSGISKKKKLRRSANSKNSSDNEKKQKFLSHETKVGEVNGLPHVEGNERKSMLSFTDLVDGRVDGRRIGKLLVSNKEIARGSNGTVVLEGIYDGRPVAVKRLVQTHHDVALKEIQNLIASDQHSNIVRWYGVEYDLDFVYLALERCTCSLNDLIYIYSGSFQSQMVAKDQDSNLLDEYTVRLHSIMENNKNVELWKANGYPSLQLLKLMRDVVSGLAHLHELGIVHRDLKPQNVLIVKDRSLCAKISDMGISKRLLDDMSSLTQNATGYGSSGWQAPEQLLHHRQTRAVDLFSLGCVLFFCMTGGKHPFGDNIERDVNIVNDRKDLFLVDSIPEAVDLFSQLLDPNPDMRLKAQDVLHHPLFWTSETRLAFLRDASDRVELEDRENQSELLNELESIASVALNGKWDEKMETAFINNIGRYRRYKYDSVRDLLRVIRNKLNHYRELPPEIQELLGQVPEGFDGYFWSRFPKLLIEVYKVLYRYCKEEEFFQKYIKSNLI